MYVGVIPSKNEATYTNRRIPHVRGGDPLPTRGWSPRFKYSPCTWG